MYGSVFKRFREHSDQNQRDFAAYIGISQTSLSHLESGKTAPTMETMEKFARRFNISLGVLHVLALDLRRDFRPNERKAIQASCRDLQKDLWEMALPQPAKTRAKS